MKISQFVIKNSSELDFSAPLLIAIKKKYPQSTVKVIYCAFSKTQILRGATFYSNLFHKYEIVEYDFLDFLITSKPISNFIRSFTICSSDRTKLSDLIFVINSQDYFFAIIFFKNIRIFCTAIYQNLIVFLQKKIEYICNFKKVLDASSADIYFLGNRTKTRFQGRELLFKKFYSEQKPVILLPHGTHEVHAFEDAIEFNELGEKISTFNDFWHTLEQEEPWRKLGGDLNQYFHSGHPGLDQEWLDSLEIKNLQNDKLTCLFVARKFLNKGITRPDGLDQFTLNYDEMLSFINTLGDVLFKLNHNIELIIKPHPSNNFHSLNQLMHESRCENWKLSSEPIYALLGGVNFVVSIFSTTLPIISAFGLPVVLLDSDLQKYVHKRWPLLEKIYGNYKLRLNNNMDLEQAIQELLADENRLLYSDVDVIRKYFVANANIRAIKRIEQLMDWSGKQMWTVIENDFNEIKSWGLEDNPFAAIDDFSHEKEKTRWNNEEHLRAHNDYIQKRLAYIKSKDFNDYYKSESKPIDRIRWRYLMNRKAWFIMPLGWDEIAKNGNVIIDFGCGDGDTVQRLADFIDSYWKSNQLTPRKIKIIGLDLNSSRVNNAINLVKTTNKNIEIEFHVADLVGSRFPFEDCYCDYGLCTGVLEILDNNQYKTFVNEICRLTSVGIYIEDLYDEYPGGYPRDDIADEFMPYGFKLKRREIIFTEPFKLNKLSDPKKLWPILKDQNLYLEKS